MPEFLAYHDREWGFPVVEDIGLIEKLCLESFQSGLNRATHGLCLLQAMGLINDHAEGCVMRSEVDQARKALQRPC